MNSSITILVVEDNPAIQDLLSRFLKAEDWLVEVAGSGLEARAIASKVEIDVALVDINLPDEDGFSLSRYLRSTYNVGIIQVTGRDHPVDKVTGLDSGADDYLVKPIDLNVLSARVRALVRRIRSPMTWPQSTPESTPDVDRQPPPLQSDQGGRNLTPTISTLDDVKSTASSSSTRRVPLGLCYLSQDTGELFTTEGKHVALTAAESEVLMTLVSKPNRVFSQQELAESDGSGGKTRAVSTIYNRINHLRRKIEIDPDNPSLIRTVYGKGYIFIPDENQ